MKTSLVACPLALTATAASAPARAINAPVQGPGLRNADSRSTPC